ncbi:isocitrate/isopropylmalate dehydrogenase family protein [Methanohalophilus halophilus]|uniref:3-isopropylmalate dehydrogenase n=1 Tax=Methanohalophilus halophilus TaxID=2177 RepID=A0A1L3Q110_9EURY|nr:isocitrate/isopropylmalate family dehydrogenase [Methanohalophilus halophilus]APH38523.1 isocitrate dehydrogenase [Methanohalophilus halophilus]RNI08480.1 NAD-dependent isocitrate dehydrogenase [Methanohalophilus halophilus]SDW12348.1 3-isopropylmalate dehydrogenase [Methanohalophilus halophilus]
MKLAVIEGDGVGKEVIPAALQVLDCFDLSLEKIPLNLGYGKWEKTGQAITDADLKILKECDCILFGAVTTPADPNYKSVLLTIRRELDLYANIRPLKPIKGIKGATGNSDFDILVVRENTEGLYSSIEQVVENEAWSKRIITRRASERIAQIACEYAAKRHNHLTIVHKSNVIKADSLFLNTCREVAQSHNVIHDAMLVDAMAYDMVRSPEKYDVVVAPNLYGDILSDLGGALVGSLGLLPSANVGEKQAFFEPVHGSAPDIAGRGIANPIAAVLSVALLLDWLDKPEQARIVREAVEASINENIKTADLGGNSTTAQVTEFLVQYVQSHS